MADNSAMLPPSYPPRLAVRRLDIDDPPIDLVEFHDIAFAFVRGATVNRLRTPPLIDAPWVFRHRFAPRVVYIRTLNGGLYRTSLETLRELSTLLDPAKFMVIHRSVLVNVARVTQLHFASKMKQVAFRIAGAMEFVRTSRQAALVLSQRFRLGSSRDPGSRRSRRQGLKPRNDGSSVSP